jgi:hypothetical protein
MASATVRLLLVGILGVLWSRAAAAENVPTGNYECWFYSTPQPLHNFSLAAGSYTDASDVRGSVTVSGDEIRFSGGNLDGRTGIYRPDPPTISFVNADGEVVLLCGLVQAQ